MKRALVGVCLALVLVFSFAVLASAQTKGAKKSAASKEMTVSGEVVDLGCYLNHGAKGEQHKECAQTCISNGMPMGLLTKTGQLYLLTMSHDDPAPFNTCKSMAGAEVKVTGMSYVRNGMKALELKTAEAAAAAAPAK
jgi:hypothetical protein